MYIDFKLRRRRIVSCYIRTYLARKALTICAFHEKGLLSGIRLKERHGNEKLGCG